MGRKSSDKGAGFFPTPFRELEILSFKYFGTAKTRVYVKCIKITILIKDLLGRGFKYFLF